MKESLNDKKIMELGVHADQLQKAQLKIGQQLNEKITQARPANFCLSKSTERYTYYNSERIFLKSAEWLLIIKKVN